MKASTGVDWCLRARNWGKNMKASCCLVKFTLTISYSATVQSAFDFEGKCPICGNLNMLGSKVPLLLYLAYEKLQHYTINKSVNKKQRTKEKTTCLEAISRPRDANYCCFHHKLNGMQNIRKR